MDHCKAASANPKGFAHADNPFSSAGLRSGIRPGKASHVMQKRNWNSALNRRDWMMAAGGVLLAARATAQSKLLVKVAGFDRAAATAKLTKLGLRVEAGRETGTLRFRDLHNLPVEVVAG